MCVCHGACPPVLNIQLPYKECSISVSDKEGSVSISTISQNTSIHTHTSVKAQRLTGRARRCSSDTLRECPVTIAYHCHHPSSFPFDCVCVGLVQGLIGVPLPTFHQLLDCRISLLFPSLNYVYIGCVLIFSL